jgi:ribosomal protein S18 acetylase RimI-like enzyme
MSANVTEIVALSDQGDAETCAKMMADSEPWITLQRGYLDSLEIFLDSSKEAYICRDNGEIIGFLILEMSCTFKGYIKSVYVRPEKRGMGIGTSLIKFAEKRIFRETPNVFLLVSSFNNDARELYRNLGYEEIGELKDFIIKGFSEIFMRKTIGPLEESK